MRVVGGHLGVNLRRGGWMGLGNGEREKKQTFLGKIHLDKSLEGRYESVISFKCEKSRLVMQSSKWFGAEQKDEC